MNILIFNCGSSSQGFKLFRSGPDGQNDVLIGGKAKNVGTKTKTQPYLEWQVGAEQEKRAGRFPDHASAAREILSLLAEKRLAIDAIGHRFVHGGESFNKSTLIDQAALAALKASFPLAPIHNPNSYSVIEVCSSALPETPQYAVFDTAFHAGLPDSARTYALPVTLAKKYGYRKYGFHGLSYQYVSARAAVRLKRRLETLKLIICHLGTGGSSVAAIQNGHSVQTSMGYSPLAGLVMSTRCGDLDPEIVLDLGRQGYSVEEIGRILNQESGLLGLSGGFSSNLEEIINEAEKGNLTCQTAFNVYIDRLRFYLGAYTWILNRADAIIFTDDVGVNSWKCRQTVCSGVENMGIQLDDRANRQAGPGRETCISLPDSPTQVWVIPNDEESVILDEVIQLIKG